MNPSGGPSWLTTLADMALILFMVTTAQLTQAEYAGAAAQQREVEGRDQMPTVGEASLDIYRPMEGVDGLGTWLAGRSADPRERLTIRVSYAESERDIMLAQGINLINEADQAGWQARLVMQRADRSDILAMIAFDRADEPINQ